MSTEDARSRVVRIGVIGTGAMGAAHVDTLTRWVPGAQVVAVYDADSDRAKQVAHAVGAVAADSAQALVDDAGVDAVLVAAPDPLHEELALACLAAGKPTLLEKPLATTLEGSRRVVDAEVAGGRRLLQLGFMRRYDPAYVELREAVLDGRVGEVRAAHCLHRNAQAHPSATSEGVLVNSMIHEFDCVPWLLDDPVGAVTVFAPRVADGALRDVQVAVLETSAGRSSPSRSRSTPATATTSTPRSWARRARCRSPRRTACPYAATAWTGVRSGPTSWPAFVDAYRIELAAWVEGVRSGTPTGPSAWDGYQANAAAFAAVDSLHGGGRVVVEREDPPALYR